MLERLFGRGGTDRCGAPGAEWAAGRSEDDAPHILAPARAHGLEQRIVLRIDRQHGRTGSGGAPHEQAAGAD